MAGKKRPTKAERELAAKRSAAAKKAAATRARKRAEAAAEAERRSEAAKRAAATRKRRQQPYYRAGERILGHLEATTIGVSWNYRYSHPRAYWTARLGYTTRSAVYWEAIEKAWNRANADDAVMEDLADAIVSVKVRVFMAEDRANEWIIASSPTRAHSAFLTVSQKFLDWANFYGVDVLGEDGATLIRELAILVRNRELIPDDMIPPSHHKKKPGKPRKPPRKPRRSKPSEGRKRKTKRKQARKARKRTKRR